MTNTYVVYKHTNLINNKSYIGITKYGENPNYRWRNGMGYQENNEFFEDIIKYGWNNFSHEILESELDEIEAIQKEKEYIKKYDCVNNGYNRSQGGNVLSPNGIEAIRNALIGIKREQSSIDKQMATKTERYGSGRGVNYRGIQKKVKCIQTNDVFASAAEAIRWCGSCKVRECCKGKRNFAGTHPITGEKLSWQYADENDVVTIFCEEDNNKKQQIKKIQCIETQMVYKNAAEAQKMTGIAACNILRACKGERKTAGKLHWVYYNTKE